MISRKNIEEIMRHRDRLGRDHPKLLNDDINAILVAASNIAMTQAIYSLGTSVDRHEGEISINVHRDPSNDFLDNF